MLVTIVSSRDLMHWPWQLSYLSIKWPIPFHRTFIRPIIFDRTYHSTSNGPVIFHSHTLIQPVSSCISSTGQLVFVLCSHCVFNHQTSVCCWLFCMLRKCRAADVIIAHEGLLILHVNLHKKMQSSGTIRMRCLLDICSLLPFLYCIGIDQIKGDGKSFYHGQYAPPLFPYLSFFSWRRVFL